MTVSRATDEGGARGRSAIVVGAGIGGLACALALHARGWRTLVLEREPALTAVGAGLQLGPNAVRVLNALGLGDDIRRFGGEARDAWVLRGRDGRRLAATRFSQAQARWGAPYLQVLRSDLQALLREAVEARGAGALRFGAAVACADPAGAVVLAGGERLGAELVVAADGLRSVAAAGVPGGGAPRPLRQSAWRALIPVDRLSDPSLLETTQVRIGSGGHLVTYPVAGGRRINLVAVVEDDPGGEESWTASGDPAVLHRVFGRWAQPAPALQQALAEGALWRGALYDRPPREPWSKGRLVLLGDAAHPMSPSFAQGAGMAIEDAWVLAEALDRLPVEPALAAYADARRGRMARVQAQSRLNARLFHLPDALSTAAFLAAQATGRDGGLARFDWLYGGGPIPAPG